MVKIVKHVTKQLVPPVLADIIQMELLVKLVHQNMEQIVKLVMQINAAHVKADILYMLGDVLIVVVMVWKGV